MWKLRKIEETSTLRSPISHRKQFPFCGQLNFQPSDFFIESTFRDSYSRVQPCYLLTKKGSELLANKIKGPKGARFTAAYVTQFNEMENTLKNPKLLREERLCRNTLIREA